MKTKLIKKNNDFFICIDAEIVHQINLHENCELEISNDQSKIILSKNDQTTSDDLKIVIDEINDKYRNILKNLAK